MRSTVHVIRSGSVAADTRLGATVLSASSLRQLWSAETVLFKVLTCWTALSGEADIDAALAIPCFLSTTLSPATLPVLVRVHVRVSQFWNGLHPPLATCTHDFVISLSCRKR